MASIYITFNIEWIYIWKYILLFTFYFKFKKYIHWHIGNILVGISIEIQTLKQQYDIKFNHKRFAIFEADYCFWRTVYKFGRPGERCSGISFVLRYNNQNIRYVSIWLYWIKVRKSSMNITGSQTTWDTIHKAQTKYKTKQKATKASNVALTKNVWWTQVLANGRQFLCLIRRLPCYS